MRQLTLAAAGFERYGKTTRRAVFLAEMERVVSWPALCGLIEPFYPKAGNGRPPVGVERMLRIYVRWPICSWHVVICCAATGSRVPARRQYAAQQSNTLQTAPCRPPRS
jgi:hypothetical protein